MAHTITNIPRIMRSKGWVNGARLMETWFSRPRTVAPAYGAPDTTTIRMDSWVLTFLRARRVYDQLVRERIWANPPAQRQIAKMLRRSGALGSTARSFGNLGATLPFQDRDYINLRPVPFGGLDLDDLSAALGNFAFRVLVAGSVGPAAGAGGHEVTISEVGVYVRDSYDFNRDQFLGYWDDSDNSVSAVNPLSGTAVRNRHFREWRSKTGRGGDFLVFSDVKRSSLTRPDRFVI
ncbi:MAG: DUF6402 family protein [Burkholderiales bacterium]